LDKKNNFEPQLKVQNISGKMNYPQVSIVVLNWNGWEDTIECLESLYQINYPKYDVIVVDNGSEDDSINNIKKYCNGEMEVKSNFFTYNLTNKPIKIIEFKKEESEFLRKETLNLPSNKKLNLIKNDENYGFAEGNNIGMIYALQFLGPDYVLLLNNDTFVDKHFLEELVKVADEDAEVSSVQSLLLKPGGKLVDSMGQELLIWSARDIGMDSKNKKLTKNREIFGACAAAALYRSKALKRVGLFDKDFFAIYEDVDLSWRIRLDGFKSVLAVNSIVYHKRNISKSVSKLQNMDWMLNPDERWYHLTKNMMILAIRYHPSSFLSNPKYLFKLLSTLLGSFYFSLREKKLKKTFKIIRKNFKIRKNLNNNSRLKDLQKKWIS